MSYIIACPSPDEYAMGFRGGCGLASNVKYSMSPLASIRTYRRSKLSIEVLLEDQSTYICAFVADGVAVVWGTLGTNGIRNPVKEKHHPTHLNTVVHRPSCSIA